MINGMEAAGVDHEALLDTYIRATNLCTQGRPADLCIGLHMCRGNFRGMHFSEGGYERISKKVFNDVDVDTFFVSIFAGFTSSELMMHLCVLRSWNMTRVAQETLPRSRTFL